MIPVRCALAAVLALAVSAPRGAYAQADTSAATRRGWSLRRTMDVFIGEGLGSRDFFPRRGDWTFVVTREQADGSRVLGIHRIPAAQTDSAMEAGGPICDSFALGESVVLGTLVSWTLNHEEDLPWRRVSATRFVPPGAPAGSPLFVEWRREDGRWVIDRYGEERGYVPRLSGHGADEVVPERPRTPLRLPLSSDTPLAPGAAWFRDDRGITVGGRRFLKYGAPRRLQESDVIRYGALHGVPVYAEPQVAAFPRIVYVPVDRAGTFQSYQEMGGNGCEH